MHVLRLLNKAKQQRSCPNHATYKLFPLQQPAFAWADKHTDSESLRWVTSMYHCNGVRHARSVWMTVTSLHQSTFWLRSLLIHHQTIWLRWQVQGCIMQAVAQTRKSEVETMNAISHSPGRIHLVHILTEHVQYKHRKAIMHYLLLHLWFSIFALEKEANGSRSFIVSTYECFWERYSMTPPSLRHHYEVIRSESPCHLYFGEPDASFSDMHIGICISSQHLAFIMPTVFFIKGALSCTLRSFQVLNRLSCI